MNGGLERDALREMGQDLDILLQQLDRVAIAGTSFYSARQLNTPLECGEVEAAQEMLRCGRAPGPDGLRAEHLRNAYLEVNLENGKVLREYT